MAEYTNADREVKVSVIMPAYRAARYLETAVRSVMAQSFPDWELLILDDCSDDDTLSVAQALAAEDGRIRVLPNEENLGAAATRNRGVALSRGEYAAFLDSDDLWHPDKLAVQLEKMARTGSDLSCCSYHIIDAQGNPAKKDYIVPEQVDFEALLRENTIGCSTVVLRRQLALENPFRPEYFHEDYVLWLQLLRSGCRCACCREVLASWRYAAGTRSFDKSSGAKNRWRIYREYLGLPLGRSIRLFCAYAVAGIKKYLR